MDPQGIESIFRKAHELGKRSQDPRTLDDVVAFDPKFTEFKAPEWDVKELKTRFLYVNAVLDQGSDMIGTREFLRCVTNRLYEMGIRFLHHPEEFMVNTPFIEPVIKQVHSEVAKERESWAKEFLEKPQNYNLLLVSGERVTQVLPHVLFSWGLPLAMIQKTILRHGSLIQWLDQHKSAQTMSDRLKDDPEFGLGKAIGNKACNLLTKWLVDTHEILPLRTKNGWSKNSFEIPIDSNIGRVFVMSGVASFYLGDEILSKNVLQQKSNGSVYIRATNLRDREVQCFLPFKKEYVFDVIREAYNARFRKITFPRFLNVWADFLADDTEPRISILDDGFMNIALNWCRNRSPGCDGRYDSNNEPCPLRAHCLAYNEKREMLTTYYT